MRPVHALWACAGQACAGRPCGVLLRSKKGAAPHRRWGCKTRCTDCTTRSLPVARTAQSRSQPALRPIPEVFSTNTARCPSSAGYPTLAQEEGGGSRTTEAVRNHLSPEALPVQPRQTDWRGTQSTRPASAAGLRRRPPPPTSGNAQLQRPEQARAPMPQIRRASKQASKQASERARKHTRTPNKPASQQTPHRRTNGRRKERRKGARRGNKTANLN